MNFCFGDLWSPPGWGQPGSYTCATIVTGEPVPTTPLPAPQTDPTSIFDLFRGSQATELLVAAVAHLHVFEILSHDPLTAEQIRGHLGLAERPFVVLLTALRAMKLIDRLPNDSFAPSPLAREHLTPGAEFEVDSYLGLAADSPGVVEMVQRLRSNRPAGADAGGGGAAFIFGEGIESAM